MKHIKWLFALLITLGSCTISTAQIKLSFNEIPTPITFTTNQINTSVVSQMLRIIAINGKDTLRINLPKYNTESGAQMHYVNNQGLQFYPAETAVITLTTQGKTYSTVYRSRDMDAVMPKLQTSTFGIDGHNQLVKGQQLIRLNIHDSTFLRVPSNYVTANDLATLSFQSDSQILITNPNPKVRNAPTSISLDDSK